MTLFPLVLGQISDEYIIQIIRLKMYIVDYQYVFGGGTMKIVFEPLFPCNDNPSGMNQ